MIGQVIDGRYQILRELGAGGMGKVYEAVHVGTSRRVAVKVILAEALTRSADTVGRFQREARAAGAIDSQHLVEIIDTGVDPNSGRPYLAMELMKGCDAQQLVRRIGPLAPDVALRIVMQACRGLRKAHEAGVIHRDIKPANLFLAEKDDEEILVKILDFGIAKVNMEETSSPDDAALTRTGAMLGSPLYMAPEQARGRKDIDCRADLWSLGAVAYQLLAGRTPFHHIQTLGELILAICSEPVPPLQQHAPWVAPEIAQVVHAALRIDPAKRFQSASEMMTALGPLLPAGYRLHKGELRGVAAAERSKAAPVLEPAPAPPHSAMSATEGGMAQTAPPAPSRRRSKVLRLLAIAAATGALVAAGGWWAFDRTRTRSDAPKPSASMDTASATGEPLAPLEFTKETPLVILGGSYGGYSTFRLTSFAKGLADAGVMVRYQEERDQAARARALSDGKADLVVTTLDQLLLQRPAGKIVALIDTTVGADALVLNDRRYGNLTSLEALDQQVVEADRQGRRIGLCYAGATSSEFFALVLDAHFEAFDLSALDAVVVDDAATAWEKLSAPGSELAAAVLQEPYIARARRAGYQVLLSSADVPNAIVDVVVASDRLIGRAPATVEAVVHAYYRRIDQVISRGGALARQIAEDGKLSEEDARAVVAGIHFFTAVAASRWLSDGKLDRRIAATATILTLAGRLDGLPADAAGLVEGRHMESAAANTRRLVASIRSEDPELAARLEGADEHVVGGDVDTKQLQGAVALGELGEATFAPGSGRLDVNGQAAVDAAATRISDFNPTTTVVLLSGRGGDDATGIARAETVRQALRGKGLTHRMALDSGGAKPSGESDRVTITLLRAP